jgi:hypothetical protein
MPYAAKPRRGDLKDTEVRISLQDRSAAPGERLALAPGEEPSDVLLQRAAHIVTGWKVDHRRRVQGATAFRRQVSTGAARTGVLTIPGTGIEDRARTDWTVML